MRLVESLLKRYHARFDLEPDQADTAEIDLTFRSGVEFRGTSLWVLIFAILIASIGLNVNSTAVIIGAMLISPLMGPIMALGYGAGINDSALMRAALFNLGLASLLSLIASTLYFFITPLSEAHSELLARTTPTIWDVMIAFFGGLAGVIGVTRKVKSNLIPGVAIATALMPPLCTAGYGLAVGNFQYFFGALYLFAINCVFIAIATLMMVRFMGLPSVKVLQERSILKRRTVIGIIVLLTLVPSLFLAIDLVKKEWFESNGGRFVQDVIRNNPNVLVISHQYDYDKQNITVNLAGERLSDAQLKEIRSKLADYRLSSVGLQINQSGQVIPDMNAVKRDILQNFMQTSRNEINERELRIAALQTELQQAKELLGLQQKLQEIYQEVQAQFPQAVSVQVSTGYRSVNTETRPLLLVSIRYRQRLNPDEMERIRRGLQVRAGLELLDDVQVQQIVVR
jgi:uncharacterized hydrophobic protein (TIGR00271 family)